MFARREHMADHVKKSMYWYLRSSVRKDSGPRGVDAAPCGEGEQQQHGQGCARHPKQRRSGALRALR